MTGPGTARVPLLQLFFVCASVVSYVAFVCNYSQTLITSTPMARLPWLIRTRF